MGLPISWLHSDFKKKIVVNRIKNDAEVLSIFLYRWYKILILIFHHFFNGLVYVNCLENGKSSWSQKSSLALLSLCTIFPRSLSHCQTTFPTRTGRKFYIAMEKTSGTDSSCQMCSLLYQRYIELTTYVDILYSSSLSYFYILMRIQKWAFQKNF